LELLVHPPNLLCGETEVSVISPLGTALLGLRVGAVMPFIEGGERQSMKVEGIGMRFVGGAAPREGREATNQHPPILDLTSDPRKECHA
jgi:hypothetical protein